MDRVKLKLTLPDSVSANLKGMVSRGISALEVDENGHLIVTLTDGSVHDLGKVSGDDGVSVTHEWDGTVLRVTSASGTSEADLKGDKGNKGDRGDPGVSVTHEWNGTTLNVTSASGTSSADLKGPPGATGVHIGSDTPPEHANVWVNPEGDPTGTEDWEFDMLDGTTDEKTVVVIGAEDGTGRLGILRVRNADGTWTDIPAIVGKQGPQGYSITHSWDGTVLKVTSASGTSSADLKGDDGISPTVEISNIDGGHKISITDKNGIKTIDVMDGEDVKGDITEYIILDQADYDALTKKNATTLYLIRG